MHAAIQLGIDEGGEKKLKIIDAKKKTHELNADVGRIVIDVPKGHVLQIVPEKASK